MKPIMLSYQSLQHEDKLLIFMKKEKEELQVMEHVKIKPLRKNKLKKKLNILEDLAYKKELLQWLLR
jgi:hypothetical protein